MPEPEWLNRTINIDTGCVYGGPLTALRYPEKELVSVPALQIYCKPARPFLKPEVQAPVLTAQQQHDDLLDIEDVLGKRIVSTRLHRTVTIREENALPQVPCVRLINQPCDPRLQLAFLGHITTSYPLPQKGEYNLQIRFAHPRKK